MKLDSMFPFAIEIRLFVNAPILTKTTR